MLSKPSFGPLVLVADDDIATRFVISSTLSSEGFTVKEASSGLAAVESFKARRPDVILMDVEMPGIDGYEACARIRRMEGGAELPIVMVTGHDDCESIDRAFHIGATDFISKPINWSLIGHRLRYILRSAKQVKKIHRLAYYDKLTGLPNRALFLEQLGDILEKSRRNDGALAVFSVDLNRFKRINDSLGSEMGDAVLVESAGRLSRLVSEVVEDASMGNVGPDFCVACFGGDQFGLVLADAAGCIDNGSIAEKLRDGLARPMTLQGHEFVLTASVGVAAYPSHGASVEALMSNAESAKAAAKRLGRNTQKTYRDSMSTGISQRLQLENDLRRAISDDELSVCYQPKYDLQTLEYRGAEALLRWQHPQQGQIPPSRFIAIAEESGLITDLGHWLALKVCEQVLQWQDIGIECRRIAINVSGQEFTQGDPFAALADAVDQAGIGASAIELEITETVLMSNTRSIMKTLHALKEAGFSLAVDDFGTGYSSLQYLQKFPVDVLKIDGSFVRHADVDRDSRAICVAIVALARSLGLQVIAEGIENNGQLEFLRQAGCDMAQGYLLSKPVSAADLTQRLRHHSPNYRAQAKCEVVQLSSRR